MSSEEHHSGDPLERMARGGSKGLLDWSEEKIKELVVRFKNRELAFVKDVEMIKTIKEQRDTPEWRLFARHINDPKLRVLFQMGQTLRKLDKAKGDTEPLRKRIYKKFEAEGLHISQVVQNGIFSKYIASILERSPTEERLKSEIENLFNNVEDMVAFIKSHDSIEIRSDEIYGKIVAHSPRTFIISSAGEAIETCERVKKRVLKRLSNHEVELYESTNKRMYFINRIDEIDS